MKNDYHMSAVPRGWTVLDLQDEESGYKNQEHPLESYNNTQLCVLIEMIEMVSFQYCDQKPVSNTHQLL